MKRLSFWLAKRVRAKNLQRRLWCESLEYRRMLTGNSPVAVDDAYFVEEGGLLSVGPAGVLANDSDAEGDVLTASLVSGPQHGTLQLNSDGAFAYQHNGEEVMADSFVYQVSDGTRSDTATVSVFVDPLNDAPTANDDVYSLEQGGALAVAAPGVLGNDLDVDGDALTVELVTGPVHGELTLNQNGSFSYLHSGEHEDAVSFTYRALDGNEGSAEATVIIEVLPADVEGDFNADGQVGVEDIDILCSAVQHGDTDSRFDIDGSGSINGVDFDYLIEAVIGTSIGDSNLDGQFDSGDLVLVFKANEYDDGVIRNSTWAEGDWDCTGDFDSGDLVNAFAFGTYVSGAGPQHNQLDFPASWEVVTRQSKQVGPEQKNSTVSPGENSATDCSVGSSVSSNDTLKPQTSAVLVVDSLFAKRLDCLRADTDKDQNRSGEA
ncbi:MAG: tandem-95 repeat protein [Planctomycetales bacterium]|nr:tandem-95 repeat protein [Planctomycetales bacterium]